MKSANTSSLAKFFSDDTVEKFDPEDVVNHEKIPDSPFGEEFNSDDVVNKFELGKEEKRKKPKVIGGSPDTDEATKKTSQSKKQPNMDDIASYDEDVRKGSYFNYEWGTKEADELTSEEKILQDNFQDFLVYRNIAGHNRGVPHNKRIPSEYLFDSGDRIQVEDDPEILNEDSQKLYSTVLVYRNDNEEILYIEIICSCGEKTIIKFDYDETSKVHDTKKYIVPTQHHHVDTDVEPEVAEQPLETKPELSDNTPSSSLTDSEEDTAFNQNENFEELDISSEEEIEDIDVSSNEDSLNLTEDKTKSDEEEII